MIIYNKLVRDRIPEIIHREGKTCIVRKIQDVVELQTLLERKLDEEIREYLAARNAEELADILEVVFALGERMGVSNDALLDLRKRKAEKRGGFQEGLFLESVGELSDEPFLE